MEPQREWFEKDYYQVLGVSSTATPKEVTSAYRKLARELHPDRNPGDNRAEERFKEVSAAYDVVGDEAKRSEYDKVRAMVASGMRPGGGPRAGGGFRVDSDMGDVGDLGDLLGNLFGQRGGPGGAAGRRGADLETTITVSFVDAVRGVETSVPVGVEEKCPDCSGSGAALGSEAKSCPECRGRGVVQENQGLFGFSRPCGRCSGRGTVVDRPCLGCHGSGVVRRTRDVRLRVPAGVSDGQTIRVKGKGATSRGEGPPGDLFVHVKVTGHRRFGREGTNLTISVPVTFPELALGAEVKVPTLDNDTVTIRIPAGTRSGRTFRVRNRGVQTSAGRGDLLVTVEVAVPARLTREQTAALEAFRDATAESPRADLGA